MNRNSQLHAAARNAFSLPVVLLLTMIGMFTAGCSSDGNAANIDTFNQKAAAAGFSTEDQTAEIQSEGSIGGVKNASAIDQDNMQIQFFVFNTDSDADTFYSEQRDQVQALKQSNSTDDETSGSGKKKYTLSTGTGYYVVETLDQTGIRIAGSSSEKAKVDQLLTSLSY